MSCKYYLIFFVFLNTSLYAYQDEDTILNNLRSVISQKNVNVKEKYNKLITYLNTSNLKLSESKVGFFYYKIGVEFYRLKDYESAIYFTNMAVKIFRNYTDTEPKYLKKSLSNLGLMYRKLGDNLQSIAAFQEVLVVEDEDSYHGKAYRELARLYFVKGDYERALEHIKKSIRIYEKQTNPKDLYLAYNSKTFFQLNINHVKYKEEILQDLQISDSLVQKIKSKKKKLQYKASINTFKGGFYSRSSKHEKAIMFYEKALQYAQKLNDSVKIYRIKNNLGLNFFKLKNYRKARHIYKDVLKNTTYKILRSDTYNNLGDYYTQMRDFEKAEEMYLNSINIFTKSKNKIPTLKELEFLVDKSSMRDLLEQTADFYYKKFTLTNDTLSLYTSLKYIKLVDELIDMIRLENKEQKSKLYWRTKGKGLYLKGVRIAHLLNKTSDAFYFMEKSKVLLLLEDITDEQAKQLSRIPNSLRYKDTKFKNRIFALASKLSISKETDKDSIKDLLFSLKRNYALFKDSINTQFPTYAHLRKDINIIHKDTLSKEIINDSTAVVSYILHENEGYGLVITKEKSKLFQIENVKQLKEILHELKDKITEPFFSEDDFKSFNGISQKAYSMLFGKIENELKGKNRLIIVPDESIATIPFETLQKEQPDYKNALQPKYLFYDMHISYAFSISHLRALQELNHDYSKRFIGIAPVDFEQDNLTSLPNTEIEIKEVNEIFSGNLLLHEEATKKRSIESMEEYAIIHIATHANYKESDGSWLWFRDDKLTFGELHSLKNNADLVVLNACKTLQGNEVQGEGVMSLSRGFFASGAKSVVASLWNSNDGSTKKITTLFYEQLKNKTPKDIALSLAKREYLQSHYGSEISPYYWASIILTGNTTPLGPEIYNSSNNFIWFILIGIVLMVIIYKFNFSKYLLYKSKQRE